MKSRTLYLNLLSSWAPSMVLGGAPAGPTVDLAYGLWKATVNESVGYYNFSNIRYGQPPIGNLRFAAPQPPLVNRSSVNDGQDGRICPQAYVSWAEERTLFIDAYFKGEGNVSSFMNDPPPGINPTAKPPGQKDPRSNEDCLFLDVIVPKGVYNRTGGKAPVFVWTFGGGFYEGSAESQGDPAGLIAQSISDPSSSPGIVYVAINYRLGAFGWLAGPTFSASGGTPNAALLDQRLALYWIQENIHLFGGDPGKVTIAGESAGAAMNLHQITAYGGAKDAPFQQAVLGSPSFNPNPYDWLQEETYQTFLENANASNLSELRAASTDTIIAANELSVFSAKYGGSGGFGPVVDGDLVPQLPPLLLAQGRYAKNVRAVFPGHNTDEGFIFIDPAAQNTSAFNARVSTTLLDAQPEILAYIENTLYPPVFDNQTGLGYNDTISRLATLTADVLNTCNVYGLLQAFGPNVSYAFLFEEGRGLHAEDTPYTFYNYQPTEDVYGFGLINATVAQTLQDWILNFAATGNPNGPRTASIPTYGAGRTMGALSNNAVGSPVVDPAGKERCEFWQKALYV